jgi:LuxR family maltose regulon positive regulatory protein
VIERATSRLSRPGWFADLLRAEEVLVRLALDEAEDARAVAEGMRDTGSSHRWALARARAATGDGAGAAEVVDELLARRGVAPAMRVRAEVVAAAVDLQRGRSQHARTVLARALRTASQEQLRAPFVEAPPPVAGLLADDAELSGPGAWLGTSTVSGRAAVPLQRPPKPRLDASADARVIEPLTAKELEVLGHLSQLLTTEEIASTMFVSVNTIRTHVRSILRKLAVSRRNEAVRRGRALGLVGS